MLNCIISSTALMAAALGSSAALAQDTPPAQSPQMSQPAPPAQAAPATPATVKASDTVYDTAGNVVGTIESVEGANAVLSTGTVKVQVPVSVISQGAKGPTISVTKAEVEAQAKKTTPQP